eukprot:scaffold6475_cov67-Phaeocystis_antarctica.AAC.1
MCAVTESGRDCGGVSVGEVREWESSRSVGMCACRNAGYFDLYRLVGSWNAVERRGSTGANVVYWNIGWRADKRGSRREQNNTVP